MAKKRSNEIPPLQEVVTAVPVEEVMHNSMIPYAEYVVMERALPRVEDGLKPVQRRILYTMMELGNTPDKPYKKSARVAGDTMGKYHPHGDSSIYDAMVRMAQDFVMGATLVDGHGNFGSIDGDSPAAMRYTEVRMTPLALELLRDIEKDTVGFRLNFDDTLKEPDVLPGRFPNLLVNGAMGIAVGLATNIPTHNLGEVIDGIVAQMDDPHIKTDALMKIIPGPDFPTGGMIIGNEGIREAYETGRGKIRIRSKCTIENAPGGKKAIVIHEVPYQVNKAAMLEKILRLSEERKDVLGVISDIRDESDREGLRAVIEIRKGGDPEKILQYLYRYSDLEVTFGINMVAIAESKPKQLSLKEINAVYIRHQQNVVTRRLRYDKEQAEAREHILEGLVVALYNIDEVIAIIRGSATVPEAKRNLMRRFDFTGIQAQAILDMRLQRLTSLEISKLEQELKEIRAMIAKIKSILASKTKLLHLIRDELLDIKKKYARPRRTKIVDAEKVEEFNAEDFIVVEDVVITVTRGGYVKRLPEKTYQRSNRVMPDDMQNDRFIGVLPAKTDQKLVLFTDSGMMLQIPAADIPEGRWKDRGASLNSIITAYQNTEEIVSAFVVQEIPDKGEMMFSTAQGMSKKTLCSAYVTRNKRIAACQLKDGDRLISAEPVVRGAGMLYITRKGMILMTRNSQIAQMGRATQGVRGITLEDGDEVLLAAQTPPTAQIVVMTDTGYAKRMTPMDLTSQKRGGKGNKCIQFYKNGANGTGLAAAFLLDGPASLVVTQKTGEVTEVDTESLPLQRPEGRGAPTQAIVVLGNEILSVSLKKEI
ncbi:MAG: DNA gyrase/topoisomerase IV subunit A [Christensenellales bacterium]|jgi:DNA gyrase subunit A